jgi:hypothetical protein
VTAQTTIGVDRKTREQITVLKGDVFIADRSLGMPSSTETIFALIQIARTHMPELIEIIKKNRA